MGVISIKWGNDFDILQYTICIKLFTDGSVKSNKAGCGIYISNIKFKKHFKINDTNSSYEAELQVILWGLKWITWNKTIGINFVILSDCQCAVKSIFNRIKDKTKCKNSLLIDIANTINTITNSDINFSIVWIRRIYNTIADGLAKEARTE